MPATEPTSDLIGRGVFASRPTAGIVGRLYVSTDTSAIYRDNGSSWDLVPTGSSLTVEEVDGSPTNAAIAKIVFPNDSLTIVGTTATIRDVPRAVIGATATKSGTQAVSGSTATTAILYDTEVSDTDGFHSTVSNTARMTIPAGLGGKYLAIGYSYVTGIAATSNYVHARIRLNGATTVTGDRRGRSPDDNTIMLVEAIVDLVPGDYLEHTVESDDGTYTIDGSGCRFMLVKIDSGRVGQGIGAKAFRSTTQVVATGGGAVIGLDSEAFDTDGFHDPVTNNSRMTIPAGLGGKYLVEACLGVFSGATYNWLDIRKNGVVQGLQTDKIGSTDDVVQSVAAVLDLVPGDYVELHYQHGNGVSQTVYANGTYPLYLTIMRLDSGQGGTRGELGYAEITSPVTIPKTQTVGADVAGLSVTVNVATRPIKITAYTDAFDSLDSGKRAFLTIYDSTAAAIIQTGTAYNGTSGNAGSITAVVRVNPAAGTRTYKVRASVEGGSSTDARFYANAIAPAFILVEEI